MNDETTKQVETKQVEMTPGQWKLVGETTLPDGTEAQSIISDGLLPHFVCHCEGPYRVANARAIAAVPDLIAALRECFTDENASGMQQGLGRQKRRLLAINATVEAALKKAGCL